jgi:hypothetical protein
MTWKQDRIYVFLWAGLIRNNDSQKKYFYDRESKLFFQLRLSDKNIYTIPDKYADRYELLDTLRNKVQSKSTDIFEFVKLENVVLDPDFPKPAKDSADWQKRFNIEQEQFNAIRTVLDKNNIDPETSDVLE